MNIFDTIIFAITKEQTLFPILFVITDHDIHKKTVHFNLQNLLNFVRFFGVSFFFIFLAIKIFIKILSKIILLPFKIYQPAFFLPFLCQIYHRQTDY